ncbi:hypothetical protein JW758_00995 [Candidatus Peregrinibacteria bacterium]|nr:hypothetical protein [Candidatus Peregrinibacteria bacterium]
MGTGNKKSEIRLFTPMDLSTNPEELGFDSMRRDETYKYCSSGPKALRYAYAKYLEAGIPEGDILLAIKEINDKVSALLENGELYESPDKVDGWGYLFDISSTNILTNIFDDYCEEESISIFNKDKGGLMEEEQGSGLKVAVRISDTTIIAIKKSTLKRLCEYTRNLMDQMLLIDGLKFSPKENEASA